MAVGILNFCFSIRKCMKVASDLLMNVMRKYGSVAAGP
jgi:hypothetical protein